MNNKKKLGLWNNGLNLNVKATLSYTPEGITKKRRMDEAKAAADAALTKEFELLGMLIRIQKGQ